MTQATETGPSTKLIARIWRGQTSAERAEEYTRYLDAAGVQKIAAIPGNRGVQMLRSTNGGLVEFQVLSYWDSLDAVRRFAGNEYEKVNPLPLDSQYMVGAEPTVRHFEVVVNDWSRL